MQRENDSGGLKLILQLQPRLRLLRFRLLNGLYQRTALMVWSVPHADLVVLLTDSQATP